MNSDKYVLQEVVTPALEREWLDLPKKIYKGNRNWVCPLDTDIRKVFDPARNEQFADGEAVRWVVRNRAGEVVGRIAAFYNREKASLEEQPTGGCGFFESIDDQQVADQMRSISDSATRGGACWSRATSSSRCTRIPTTRLITRSCSRTTDSGTTSTRTPTSGKSTTTT